MTPDETRGDYLWDPGAAPDPDVARLERQLSVLRFDPDAAPLAMSPRAAARPSRRWHRPLVMAALAASLLVVAGSGLWAWRWSWPEGRGWTIRSESLETRLEVGRPLTLPRGDRATANIGRIGTMRIGGGTSLELRSTAGTRHRLRLSEGFMHVRVWAPPASVVVETPAGEVIDMGCEFVLSVSGDTSHVSVRSGWVQITNDFDEVLIPAGASSEMTAGMAPAVPVFDDSREGFRNAVRTVERRFLDGPIDQVLELARARDVYTLLVLADTHPVLAPTLLARASELSPPPGEVTIGRILRGDRNALWAWTNSLPLPPPKSAWWRNWRDALPLR
jgi:ferric-dicitrate binding protein FerR (iron transport regulator)